MPILGLLLLASAVVPLDALDSSTVVQGWGTPQIDRSVQENPLRIGGREFYDGVGTHANSEWRFKVAGRAQTFRAIVGIDDETRDAGSAEFQIVADGRIVARSGILHAGRSVSLEAKLTGADVVSLIVTDGGDGIASDHADWCEASFMMAAPNEIPTAIGPGPRRDDRWIYPTDRTDRPLGLPVLELPLHFVSTADDDGGAARDFPRALIPGIVRYMNACFAEARIHFSCDPERDFETIRSTVLNRDFKPDATVYPDEKQRPAAVDIGSGQAREALARRYPTKFVVVARRGSNWEWDARQKRWRDVVSYENYGGGYIFTLAGPQDPEIFVHEAGHSLGLAHTFGLRAPNVREAARLLRKAIDDGLPPERALEAFDGDRDVVADTPPDVSNDGIYGGREAFRTFPKIDVPVALADGTTRTYTVQPDPFNHMSYFMEARWTHPAAHRILGHFSRQQILVVRRRAEQRLDDTGRIPDHSRSPGPIRYEFEALRSTTPNAKTQLQAMPGNAVPDGVKPGQHVWVRSEVGDKAGFRFDVEKAGRYRVWWAGSYAADYGVFEVSIDGSPLGRFDGWIPGWMPTGWRRFGSMALSKGPHAIVFAATGKNPMSRGAMMGLDAFSLEPIPKT